MKYAVIKTVTEIGVGIDAKIDVSVSLFDNEIVAKNEATRIYSLTVNDYSLGHDLYASTFEYSNLTSSVVAKVFGNTDVVVIATKKIDGESEVG